MRPQHHRPLVDPVRRAQQRASYLAIANSNSGARVLVLGRTADAAHVEFDAVCRLPEVLVARHNTRELRMSNGATVMFRDAKYDYRGLELLSIETLE